MNTELGSPTSKLLSSIPASPSSVAAVQRLLGYIDDLPSGATGALHFGDLGVILLESRKICRPPIGLTDVPCRPYSTKDRRRVQLV